MIKNRYYLIALLILVVDFVTKWMVRVQLRGNLSFELIPGYLRFSYCENTGVAFSLFDSVTSVWKPYILAGMAIIAVVGIAIHSVNMPAERKLLQASLSILTGGILGNFLDRLLRGYVIDFIDFHIHDVFTWPTFNAADSAITIGIALLLIDTVKNPVAEKAIDPPEIQSSN
jgi:signal peptidase II